jgi:hypothetical protein
MMLRLLVLVLLLANGAYYAWSQGLLAVLDFAPATQTEPQRLIQQIKPESLRLLNADEAKPPDVAAAAARPVECLLAGPFDDAQVAPLRTGLMAWPAGSWSFEPSVEPARWIVYMGKYPSPEAVNKKKGELRQLGVSFQPLVNPALELGLSLGGFTSEERANEHLNSLAQRGVRTARVVVERPELRGQLLRLLAVDDAMRPRLDELKASLAGSSLRACR